MSTVATSSTATSIPETIRIHAIGESNPPTTSSNQTTTSSSRSATQNQLTSEEEENIYDEIEIEDMTYDDTLGLYHYPCPCGDRFEIHIGDLRDGTDIAICPGCSLMIRVIFDQADLPPEKSTDEDEKKEP